MPFLKNREVKRPMVGFSLKAFKVLALGIALFVSGLNAQTAELLWPQGAPGALGTADGDKPSVLVYPASGAKLNGAAVVICPGGAYWSLATSYEGVDEAVWMNTLGVSAFVLKYRLGPKYHHPIEMNDAQRALRWVRANATRFKIDVKRVGIMGFSAGGHLAATAATHFDSGAPGAVDPIDRYSCRPDFSILIYPVITMTDPFTHVGSRDNLLGNAPSAALINLLSNEKQVTAKTSPAFLVHGRDDGVVNVANSQMYYDSCLKAKVPAQLNLFDHGPHGFGMGGYIGNAKLDTGLASWPWLCAAWLRNQGMLTVPTALHPQPLVTGKPLATSPGTFHEKFDFLGRFHRFIRRL